jgi:Uma2 family endonuclease
MSENPLESNRAVREVIIREVLPRWIEEQPALRQELRAACSGVPPGRMSYDEFLDWAGEDTLAEWVDGEVVMVSPASKRHQEIAGFLARAIGTFAEERGLGTTLSAPFQMKLERSGREPDLLFVAKEHLDRLRETHLDGPADLAVEIISPESAGRDRGEKFYEYAAGGVREYWLIDPQQEWVELYHLREGRYRLALDGREGEYRALTLPDFWLRVEWLWQEPPPRTLDVLRQLDVL